MRWQAFTGLSRRSGLAGPSVLSRGLGALARALPSQCTICHAWPAARICPACTARFARRVPRCTRCALHVPDGVLVCGACLRAPPPLDRCLAAVDYAYPWAGVLADFKFRGEPGAAAALAALLRHTPGLAPMLAAADLVLPIPLSAERLRERGFNQALLLARQLAPAKVQPTLLRRLHTGAPQAGLARAERLRHLHGAFAVDPAPAAALQGRQVVLVDDVMTTGATLHAAAAALRGAGVAGLGAVVWARTAPPRDSAGSAP